MARGYRSPTLEGSMPRKRKQPGETPAPGAPGAPEPPKPPKAKVEKPFHWKLKNEGNTTLPPPVPPSPIPINELTPLRWEIYRLGERLGFPALDLGHRGALAPGQAVWQRFAGYMDSEDLIAFASYINSQEDPSWSLPCPLPPQIQARIQSRTPVTQARSSDATARPQGSPRRSLGT